MENRYVEVGKEAVLKASEYLMQFYNNEIIPKERDIDKETEIVIRNIIRKEFPEHSFDGEETGRTGKNNEFVWYCDPISSSNNFSLNLPHFAVCLSLFQEGKPVIGIVSDPVCNELYYAEVGKGSYLNGKRIEPSKKREIKNSNFSCSPKKDSEVMRKFLDLGGTPRMFGSWALHFAYVAAGKLDFCFTSLKDIHGTVPGLIIAKEAGSYIYDGENTLWSKYSKRILVSNSEEIISEYKKDIFMLANTFTKDKS